MRDPDYSEQAWQREQNQLEELDRIQEKEFESGRADERLREVGAEDPEERFGT